MRILCILLLELVSVACLAQKKEIVHASGMDMEKTYEHPSILRTGNPQVMDFGLDAFSQIILSLETASDSDTITIHIGECMKDGRVDRNPGGSRRYRAIRLALRKGRHEYRPEIIADERNTRHPAVLMPEEIGEVTPFRYMEIEGYGKTLSADDVTRVAISCPFDDDASSFRSDSEALNRVWELCKHSVKATTYTGYYVDGDRERISYEADALINQLAHYGVDARYDVARRTFERLIGLPTWPTEWILQMDMIAWYDYLYTGDTGLIRKYIKDLRAHALFDLVDPKTHLVTSLKGQTKEFLSSIHREEPLRDIVDWPHSGTLGLAKGQGGEDDGYVYEDYNTVVNAYHYMAVTVLSRMYQAIGDKAEAKRLNSYLKNFRKIFVSSFLDKDRGIFRDGLTTSHCSLHANMFAMAFGLAGKRYASSVASFIRSRGMACSVYGSLFLLDALFSCGEEDYAIGLLTSDGPRSWLNMIREGSTITMEAWGNRFKPNQDWNHAWGAAPASIIPMRILGVRPLRPGFEEVEIHPQLGPLGFAEGTVPSPKGGIRVKAWKDSKGRTEVQVQVPDGMKARIVRK